MRVAFFSCSRMRKASVLRPRKVRKQSKGEGVAPAAFCKYLRLSYNVRSFKQIAPPTTSAWPPMYLVVEWSTRSAPNDSGR